MRYLLVLIMLVGCTPLKSSRHEKPFEPHRRIFHDIDIVLVLGSGGVRGLAHVGVIEELVEAGIKPDLIIGCSSGAIVGALYADNQDIEYLKKITLSCERHHMLDISLTSLPLSLSSGRALSKYMHTHLSSRTFEELRLPFIAVATNLEFGNLTEFHTGLLVPAVRASAACPGAFYPVLIGGQYFVDGAVVNPIPISVAKQFNPKIIIAVDITEKLPEQMPSNLLGILSRAFDIHYAHHSAMAVQEADVVIEFSFKNIGAFNSAYKQQIYEAGRRATRKLIPLIKRKIATEIPERTLCCGLD